MKAKRVKPIKIGNIIKRMVSFYVLFLTICFSLYSISDDLFEIQREHTMVLENIQYSAKPETTDMNSVTETLTENMDNSILKTTPYSFMSYTNQNLSSAKTENTDVTPEVTSEPVETTEPVIVETTPEPTETPEPVVEEVITEPEITTEDFYHNAWSADTSVKSSSGLTAEQVDDILNGTMMYGLGSSIIDVENTYGINAFYIMSVAALESGYGSSYMARNDNNLFGMMGCSYGSYSESVYAFGRLMQSYENNRGLNMTPNGINPTYCELNTWAGKIVTLMNQFTNEANNNY